MTISELSIRRPVFAWMLMSALIIFGAIGFLRMGVSQLPDVDFPVVGISASLEGAAPEIMETDIVDPIEDAVMSVQGIRSVSSSARQGSASISVEFDLDRDIDVAMQEVQSRIGQAQRSLPRDMDPPIVTKNNPEDQPILWLNVSSDRHSVRDIMAYVRDDLKDKFSTVPGVAEVFLGGYVDPNLRVWVSNTSLNRYALSVTDILNTIRNEHVELPAGRIETPTKEFNLRALGEAGSVRAFEKITINTRGGAPNFAPIPLERVASVEEGLADVRRISRANGNLATGLGVRKQRGENAVEVGDAVKARMAQIEKTLPEGMKLSVAFDSTKFIKESVEELNFTLVLSAILTALVCWLFLGSWSSTLNVILAIPTSIIGTFIVLYFSGFTLNTFTLLALSLAIGIVVDDAIMVLENIVRHQEEGEERVVAAVRGAREITFAAIAATVAIIAIFLPVAFMKGIIGKFFFQFGVTMTAAVLLSLVEALTLTPMRAASFVSVGKRASRVGRILDWLLYRTEKAYRRTLDFALANRWKVILVSLAFFVATFFAVQLIKKEFVPAQDQSLLFVRFQTPVGSSLPFTDAKMKEAEKVFLARPEILRYFGSVGGFGGGEVNTGIFFITLKPPSERKLTQQELMPVMRKELNAIPGLKVFVQDLSTRGFSASRGFPVEFSIRGPDWGKIVASSEKIKERLAKTGLVTDLDTDYLTGMPEYQLVPDREKAAARGVTVAAVAETVNALIGGIVVGKYSQGGHRYDVRVRLVEAERADINDLKQIFVRNNRGELVPLTSVVTIQQKPTLQVITRKDRERAVTIFANVAPGASQANALAEVEKISKEVLEPGYRAVLSGSAESFKESFQSLIFALLLGIIVSYMILASQFNSFIDPVTVLIALPFSVSGAFVALALTGQSLNVFSMIGLILLMGIVKKNSILLVDFTNQMRAQGLGVRDALRKACPIRLRPILMTSTATVAGAIPPALALGPGAETRIPMSVAVIGGVIISTALTLVVVPCVYSLLASLGKSHEEAADRSKVIDEALAKDRRLTTEGPRAS